MPSQILENSTNQAQTFKLDFKKSLLVLFLVIFCFSLGYYAVLTKFKFDRSEAINQARLNCEQSVSRYNSEFGTNINSCQATAPNLTQNWNYFDIENQAQTMINGLNTAIKPNQIEYDKRLNEFKKAKQDYLGKRDFLSKLDYKDLPSLNQVESEIIKEGVPNRLVLLKEYYENQNQSLTPALDRLNQLLEYKQVKFWDRIEASKTLNVPLPSSSTQLIEDYKIDKNSRLKYDSISDPNKILEFSSRLTQSTLEVMRIIYPKAKESKQNTQLIDIDLPQKNMVNFPILMYHHIQDIEKLPKNEQTKDRKSLTVSPATFVAQLDKLKNSGFETVSLADLETAINSKNQSFFEGKKVIITFDDGYEEHYSVAFKELQNRGMKGVFGIITSNVSDKEDSNNLTWDKLREMQKGGMEIISHSVSHCALGSYRYFDGRELAPNGDYRKCNLRNAKELNYGKVDFEMMPKEQARFEIVESRKILEEKLGVKVPYIIYPYGAYNDQVFDMMWSNGFELGFAVAGGPKIDLNTPFLLNRVTVIGNTKPDEMAGWFKSI